MHTVLNSHEIIPILRGSTQWYFRGNRVSNYQWELQAWIQSILNTAKNVVYVKYLQHMLILWHSVIWMQEECKCSRFLIDPQYTLRPIENKLGKATSASQEPREFSQGYQSLWFQSIRTGLKHKVCKSSTRGSNGNFGVWHRFQETHQPQAIQYSRHGA